MKNVGTIDRSLRALAGLVLLLAAYVTTYWWLAVVAAILLITALIQFCPIYKLVGSTTIPSKATKRKQQ